MNKYINILLALRCEPRELYTGGGGAAVDIRYLNEFKYIHTYLYEYMYICIYICIYV